MQELQEKCNYTYLTGVYLTINAILDAYLLLDGPHYCGYDKALSIYGTHDLFSNIFTRDARHRICCSGISDNKAVLDRTDILIDYLRQIAQEDTCSALFLCSMPVATILSVDYSQIISRVQCAISKPIVAIPSKSMNAYWLQGYEETLSAITQHIEIGAGAKKKAIAIVGYFFDRNEGDHIGNIAELKKICDALSVDLVSVWLDGSSYEHLKDIEKLK